ncbi:MAG: hypothetical protein SFU98_15330 [Leptospiraceae bacterium]|nr:hypothetical protein [Leptospiraceae bacterium]
MNEQQDFEMEHLSTELVSVMEELKLLRERHEKNLPAKKEALQFIDKAEKVIILAEQGKVQITEEQKVKIEDTLKKISLLFKK